MDKQKKVSCQRNSNSKWQPSKYHQIRSILYKVWHFTERVCVCMLNMCLALSLCVCVCRCVDWISMEYMHVRESHNDIVNSAAVALALFYLEYSLFRLVFAYINVFNIDSFTVIVASVRFGCCFFFHSLPPVSISNIEAQRKWMKNKRARKTCENHKHEYREFYSHTRYMTRKREHRTCSRVVYDMFRHWWQNWRIIDMNKENIDMNAGSFVRSFVCTYTQRDVRALALLHAN